MKAEAHYDKGRRIAATQAKLDPAADWETIVECCYMSAHHLLLAGTEWTGTAHPQSHAHRENVRLLKQAGAPQTVRDAWDKLEILRAGNVYGARTNGAASADARRHQETISDWAVGLHP